MELCARKDVPVEQTWDLSLIYDDEKGMWADLEKTKATVKNSRKRMRENWPLRI